MKDMTRAAAMRRAALTAALVLVSLQPCRLVGQHGNQAPRPAPPAHPAPRQQAPRGQERGPERGRPSPQQGRPVAPPARGNNVPARPQPVSPYPPQQNGTRPVYPGASSFAPQGNVRPALPGSMAAPPGHLQSWLNLHRNVPVQNQEQQLRGDPSFRRLPPGEQQRLVQQLHTVNQMPNQIRERRLARAEMMERLSPQDRLQVNRSAREWTTLSTDRQAVMKSAFRDLRAVPPDQRSIVLNSARYQGQFSTQERGILSDMLRVEPYEAPR